MRVEKKSKRRVGWPQGKAASASGKGVSRQPASAAVPQLPRATLTPRDLKPGTPRAIRNGVTRTALLDAAAWVVGQCGYADASVSRITARACIAQGTFYNYFSSRQEILDALLPRLGDRMLEHIRQRVQGISDPVEREREQFKAFFEFLVTTPEFYRVLHESEQFANKAYYLHHTTVEQHYKRWLHRIRDAGFLTNLDDRAVEVVAYILMAARDYLAMRYSVKDGNIQDIPRWVVDAYMTLLCNGLFSGPKANRTDSEAGANAGGGRRE